MKKLRGFGTLIGVFMSAILLLQTARLIEEAATSAPQK